MQRLILCIVLIVSVLALSGCQGRNKQDSSPADRMPDMEELIQANRIMVEEDDRRIVEKAREAGWALTRTETGEYFQSFFEREPVPEGTPPKSRIRPGDQVYLSYTLRLLSGEMVRSSAEAGPKRFIVEGSEAESGLHSVIKHFGPGDSVRVILPPHRAFGLMGDGDRIPGRAILWYEVRIDSVRPSAKIG